MQSDNYAATPGSCQPCRPEMEVKSLGSSLLSKQQFGEAMEYNCSIRLGGLDDSGGNS